MARYVPDPRNVNEQAALKLCLQHTLEVHQHTPGYIHVWQPLGNGSNQFVLATLPDFIVKFTEKPWMFENGLPVELYFRQQTYHMAWWEKGSVKFTPVKSLNSILVDLDCYKFGLTPTQAVTGSLNELQLEGVPQPNHVDYSGNGILGGAYLRWLLEPRDAVGELERSRDFKLWKEAVATLVDVLEPFGADRNAKDLAHWFRVPGSINSKYSKDGNGAPSFRDLIHDELVDLEELAFPLGIRRLAGDLPPLIPRAPVTDEPKQSPVFSLNDKQGGHPNQHSRRALSRLNLLRGGIKDGQRNDALYKFVVLYAGSNLHPDIIRKNAELFAARFDPPLPEVEVERTIESGLKATRMSHSYDSIIKDFGITEAEQADLNIRSILPYRDSNGIVIEANKPFHREASRIRTMDHRRLNGVEPKAVVNARKSRAISAIKRASFDKAYEKLGRKESPNISALARESDIHWQTANTSLQKESLMRPLS